MRITMTFTLFVLTLSCFAQNNYSQIPSEYEKRLFMDTFSIAFKGKHVTNWRPEYDTTFFRLWPSEKICDYFDSMECNYLLKQVIHDKKRYWKKRDLKRVGMELNSQQKNIWHFSTPLFTSDKQYAIIGIGYNCGSLCGEGDIYIYKKEGDKWILWRKLIHWVS